MPDYPRGTPIWGLNQYRSDALSALLDDLVELTHVGLTSEECSRVQRTLERCQNHLGGLPAQGFWSATINADFERFKNAYVNWNNNTGTDEATAKKRTDALKRLRTRRRKLASRISHNQYELSNALDRRMVDSAYEALTELITAAPSSFRNLAKAVARYHHKT